tara:strand:- start:43 stop:1119 length:1077 start_codon:yes stop_codon:yes gene_type:complete
MSLISKGSIATNLEIDCQINGTSFPYVTSVNYTHIVNGVRRVTVEFNGHQIIEATPIGAKVVLRLGRGDTSHNLDFEGYIYKLNPRFDSGSFVAIDYIGQLARSAIVEYKEKDIIGKDLYYLAASAANYEDVNTDDLTEGSGIFAESYMDLFGLRTRKDFIDACFDNMVELVNDDFHDEPSAVRWRYAIRRNNVLDFYKEDSDNNSIGYKMKVSEDDSNLLGRGLIGTIDNSKIINSATFQSSIDNTLHATITDEDSVERNGIASKLFQLRTTEYDKLEELAYKTVLLNKEPTYIYQLQLANAEHLTLGDYVEVTGPSFQKEILPVVDVRHVVTDKIESYITLGKTEKSISELIKEVK